MFAVELVFEAIRAPGWTFDQRLDVLVAQTGFRPWLIRSGSDDAHSIIQRTLLIAVYFAL